MPRSANAVPKHQPQPQELEHLHSHVSAASRLMKIMASEPRLMLMCRLGAGESSVNELADYACLAQSTASQHLTRLRSEGIVATRREGQTIYYRLIDNAALRVIDTLCAIYGNKRNTARKRKVVS